MYTEYTLIPTLSLIIMQQLIAATIYTFEMTYRWMSIKNSKDPWLAVHNPSAM